MTPTERFRQARDVLFRNRDDHPKARAEFRWPELTDFNWAADWFDTLPPEKLALKLVTEGAGAPESLTFGELQQRSRAVAGFLQAAGAQKGDRLLLMLNNVVPLWETMLAAIRLGVVVIPATSQLTAADLEDRLERGEVKHFITDAAGAAKLKDPSRLRIKLCTGEAPAGFTRFDEARKAAPLQAAVKTLASDPLLLYFTSGTTARPKLVLHTHASYPAGHLSTMYWIGIREGDLHQNISSPGWAKHAWSSFFAPWNAGAGILMHEQARYSAKRTLEVLREHGTTTLCAPPTVWRMLILEELGQKPPQLRELVSAGEPLNPEVIERVQKAWGLTIRDGYGQTETTAQVGNSPGLPVRPGSMGLPLPGYDVALLDAENRDSEEGEVALKLSPRPAGLMVGYLDDPERTARATASGFYRTGDEARRDADGYITFVGRGDDVFKSSDYRISPFELESVLIEHPAVAEAAIVPSPDPVRTSVPKAFLTLKPGVEANAATAREILKFCKEKLAPYKRIRCVEFTALPKTISGKIRRVELRKTEKDRRAAGERSPAEFWLED